MKPEIKTGDCCFYCKESKFNGRAYEGELDDLVAVIPLFDCSYLNEEVEGWYVCDAFDKDI